MTRQTVEKYQVLVYLSAIALGLLIGNLLPRQVEVLKAFLWPTLGVLLYVTFAQVPLAHVREAFIEGRFVAAAILGNFVIVPSVIGVLAQLLPADPAIRLGVLLVLLVPCTDWFITFTHLGGGDTKNAIAFAPVSLLLQMLLLPVYLWLFLDEAVLVSIARQEMLTALVGLILLPLFLAYLTERWSERAPERAAAVQRLGGLAVPLLSVVVFIIAATQVKLVTASLDVLSGLLVVFGSYLLVAATLARVLASLFKLPTRQGRVLAFSFGTRNSFVVLPLALALPVSFELAVVAVVFQSLVELIGMAGFLWLVPRKLFPHSAAA
ncbi:MAG: arsenic resistance protein [Anaerolineae bacterium]|nr:hypothetical protein [Thermoflexales bacterium]MDW8394871.1 arsenic resistance protein [Anaerolineae bacterium]